MLAYPSPRTAIILIGLVCLAACGYFWPAAGSLAVLLALAFALVLAADLILTSRGLRRKLALTREFPAIVTVAQSRQGAHLIANSSRRPLRAIAYEDSDCFDSISRSFSYVYNKPWRMSLYMIIAFVYGAVCYLFVRFFSFLVLWTTYTFLQLGFAQQNKKLHAIWAEPAFRDFFGLGVAAPTNWSTSVSSALIYFWVLVVLGLVVSFVISFYFSASTIIYALMRNRVDLIAIEDVYVYPAQQPAETASPQTAIGESPSDAGPNAGEKQERSE